jgi:AraC family transcriptional regulator
VRLEHVKPLIVAFVRYVGPYQTLLAPGSPLASLWENLFTWGRTHGLVVPDTLLIGIPQDDPSVTPADKQRFDVCVQVPECRHPTGSIGCQTLAPGLYGVCRHYGSFDSLADTYRRIYTQCVLNDGYTLRTAPPFEVYGSSWLRNDLHIHYTDVYMPFEPRKDETYGRL